MPENITKKLAGFVELLGAHVITVVLGLCLVEYRTACRSVVQAFSLVASFPLAASRLAMLGLRYKEALGLVPEDHGIEQSQYRAALVLVHLRDGFELQFQFVLRFALVFLKHQPIGRYVKRRGDLLQELKSSRAKGVGVNKF